jgi:hypothetical protein
VSVSAAKEAASEVDARAQATYELSVNYRHIPLFASNCALHLIGDLATTPFWTKALPLADAQRDALKKLDGLVRHAQYNVLRMDADYMDGNPPDYREYASRSERRRLNSMAHAQRMVQLGLLTEPQAAFIVQRYLNTTLPKFPLRNPMVQSLLEITESQQHKLDEIGQASNTLEGYERLWSDLPEPSKRAAVENQHDATDAAVLNVLNSAQEARWSQLRAERPSPPMPTDRRPISEELAASIRLADLSPTFRALSRQADALQLSPEQRKLLQDLHAITRLGLHWIDLAANDGRDNALDLRRTDFLKAAEQFSLDGILTQRQANELATP